MILHQQSSVFTYVYMHLLVVFLIMVQTGSAGNNCTKEKEENVSFETELPIKPRKPAAVTPISMYHSLINKCNGRLTILRSIGHDLYP